MSTYQLLYSVTVEHMYFANRVCKSLQFVPTQATAHLFSRTDLLIRVAENHLSVFVDRDQLDRLRAKAEDKLVFTFKVFSTDSHFSHYTAPDVLHSNAILYFDNLKLSKDASDRFLLHDGPHVSSADYVDVDSSDIGDDLDTIDYHVRPNFILRMTVDDNSPLMSFDQQDRVQRHFYIVFASSSTFWKYYLMDGLSDRKLYITDLDNTIYFEDVGKATLPGNHTARMLLSKHAIPMLEQPIQRFQLKENGAQRDKVLIRRLPNASVDQIYAEQINGSMQNISEIYVH